MWQEGWNSKLAQRLDKPQNWKDVNDVVYSDTKAYNFPLISSANEPAVATLSATAAVRSDLTKVIPFIGVTMTNQTLSIVTAEIDSYYVDYADQAQSTYSSTVEIGTLLGKKLGERIEAVSLANFGSWTDFGDTGGGVLGLAATQIANSGTVVDDIVRGIIEQIQQANGFGLYAENGGFVVWRPKDWTFLVTFMQANGFAFADEALRDGGKGRIGKETMGLFHYISTQHTANHLMAGVRKVQKLGILNKTFGRTYVNEMPSSSTAGSLSGTQIHSRVDYGLLVPTNLLPTIFDINVAS